MDTSKHTATPWRFGIPADSIVAGATDGEAPYVMYYGGELVAESVNHADRDFIIRACNSHDQLLAALRGGRVAIDVLMAQLIEADPSFMPTKSAAWPSLVAIIAALTAAGTP